jgi:hypothetical protein
MSYLEKFIEAIEYRNELFQELFPSEKSLDIEVYKSYSIQENIVKKDLNDFKELSLDFLSDIFYNKRINPTSGCNFISKRFKQYLHNNAKYDDNEISVTIGDVSFKGNKLYNLNKEKLRHILQEGQKDNSYPIDVHAWITYKSIYVFDPVIKLNLARRKLIPPTKDSFVSWVVHRELIPRHLDMKDCLLSWNDNNKQELDYHPLLIDNDFSHRVDHF